MTSTMRTLLTTAIMGLVKQSVVVEHKAGEPAGHGLDPAPGTREELAQYMERERQKWSKVVRQARITAE